MVSTYHGIETGRRALTYFRKGMEVAGINTAKANTEGYSRQVVNKEASDALVTSPNMSRLGTGVEIVSIERMRDQFLDARARRASVEQAYWSTMNTGMQRVDSFIINTNELGLGNLLDSFWAGLQNVHVNPSNSSIRSTFLKEADNLTQFASSLSASYNAYRDELNDDIRAMTEEANSLIDQIAILSESIRQVRSVGAEPNELLDKRDLLVDRLCRLTGATASTDIDETDGDFKVNLGGKLLVQGSNVRHLILVENPANANYYEVQVEYNQYDITSDPDVAQAIIERRADDLRQLNGSCTTDATHEMDVVRTADELYWTVGCGRGQSETPAGSRMDGIAAPTTALGIEGSFALQVGSSGVRAYSEVFGRTPPGVGNILGEPGPGEQTHYSFRLAAGDFESTLEVAWDSVSERWTVSDNKGNTLTSAGKELTVEEFGKNLNDWYAGDGIQVSSADDTLVFEHADRQILSINDISGDFMRASGLANENPIVLVEVVSGDSLQTIANKINNAYMFDKTESGTLSYDTVPPDTAPSSPEQWMHATVEPDGQGGYFLCLTSNVAGEANRINVMSGSVCGDGVKDMTVARLLGLVEEHADTGQTDVTSYIQVDRGTGAIENRYTEGGDVFVDDAYIIFDGREYLSSSDAFKDARRIPAVGEAAVDKTEEVSAGIRLFLQGTGSTTIMVRHPLTEGEIFASIKLRDDILLSHLDMFDDLTYKLATEFNAVHYAGYGSEDYENVSGMAFFENLASGYGAFGKLKVDDLVAFDQSRLAATSGDGSGKPLGGGDGSNALAMAQLKQGKFFNSGTADFNDLYKDFINTMGAFGERAKVMLQGADYVAEQIGVERTKIMGVNSNEEMLSLVELNQSFNSVSQYISTLMQVMEQIIGGVGRVGI